MSTAVLYALNMVLGTGPLTLPYAFLQGGLLLSSGFLAVCATLAYISATFTIEALALCNGTLSQRAGHEMINAIQDGNPLEESLLETKLMDINRRETSFRTNLYKIRERYELGEMGTMVLPKWLAGLLYLTLFSYTFGCLCVYAVSITDTLALLIPSVDQGLRASILVLVFFPLCFADLQRLRLLQYFIMVIRVLALVGMLSCAIWKISLQEAVPAMPMMRPMGLPCLFGNAVLSFMVHHSIPGLISPLEHQADAPQVVWKAYSISYVLYLILGYTALRAFGDVIETLYSMNFISVPIVGPLLCAYPLLMFAIYPIVAITLRNNMINALGLSPPDPERLCAPSTVFFTTIVVVLPCVVAALTNNVQAVVSISAGYFGISLMLFFMPLLMLYSRRALHADDRLALDGKSDLTSRFAQTPAMTRVMCTLVIMSGVAAIVFNTYRLFFAPTAP